MHPTSRLVVWLLLLAMTQCLAGTPLVVALLALPLCGGEALRRWGKLVWRARWLLLSLVTILAWGGAGEPLWEGPLAPSREALQDALTHLGRLLLVLMGAATLRTLMPRADLLIGAHGLVEPLRWSGFNPDRGLIRLLLVLRYLESMPQPRDWRVFLKDDSHAVDEVIELVRRPLAGRDYLAMLSVAGLVVMYCWRAF